MSSPASKERMGGPVLPLGTGRKKNKILLGSIMLVHEAVIRAGIRFDPRFFMYHEEVDFICEAGKKGFPSWYFPEVRARHLAGLGTRKTPLKKVYWTRRNSIYFLKKQQAGAGRWAKCLLTMLGGFLYAAARLRLARAGAISSGLIDGMRGISENQNPGGPTE
jgi:GT2 family glycosyltransferase